MRLLQRKKKVLTLMVFMYIGILTVGVSYAALSGIIEFNGMSPRISADLNIVINSVRYSVPTEFRSQITRTVVSTNGKSMDIVVDLRAPGDMVYIVFDFRNDGIFPAEFATPEITINGVEEGDNTVFPIIVEGFAEDGVLEFDALSGYIFRETISSMFGMAFVWDEDVHVVAEGISITVHFPYTIADISVDCDYCNDTGCWVCSSCGTCGSFPCACFTVTFDLQGGTLTSTLPTVITLAPGNVIGDLPVAVSRYHAGYRYRIFGWFTSPGGMGIRWDAGTPVTQNITLYANWVRRPVNFLVGDLNGDRRVTSADASMLARYLAGQFDHLEDSPICLIAADIDGNGVIDPRDLTLLIRWLVGHDVSNQIAH